MSWLCDLPCRVRSKIGIFGLLTLLLLCSLGLSSGAAAAALTPVRIGLVHEASAAPLFIALAENYFQAEGLDPQVRFLASDAAVDAGVAAGKLDIGMASLSARFYSFAAAHGFKIFASRSSDRPGFPMYALLLSKETQATSVGGVRELTRLRIGTADSEASTTYALFSIASRFKLDFASIKTIALKSTADELAALSHGRIDAALLPYAVAIRLARTRNALLRLSDLAAWQEGVVFTTAKTIATRRDLIARFMRAYQHGTASYEFNFLQYDDGGDFIPGPDFGKYLDLIAHQVHLAPDLLAATKTYCEPRGNLDLVDIGKQVMFWQDQGRLAKRVAAADLVDPSFIGEEGVAPQSSSR
jgi:NitT/TauT family transport system substrate-binding protein